MFFLTEIKYMQVYLMLISNNVQPRARQLCNIIIQRCARTNLVVLVRYTVHVINLSFSEGTSN